MRDCVRARNCSPDVLTVGMTQRFFTSEPRGRYGVYPAEPRQHGGRARGQHVTDTSDALDGFPESQPALCPPRALRSPHVGSGTAASSHLEPSVYRRV